MLVDPRQLRLLALIQRYGSLTSAAHSLGLTAAAITHQIARAEQDWKVPLVLRGPRGATLTPAGATLAVHGQRIEESSIRAEADLAVLLGHQSLRLRIGAFQAAALHLLPPALTAIRHRHPDAELSVVDTTSDRGGDEVAAGRLDMAVVASWGVPMTAAAHVTLHPLLRDPLVVVLPDDHRLVRRHPTAKTVRLEQLRDEAWVTILAGHAARAQFDDAAAAAGFTPKIRFQTESYDVAQALVGTGIGVALVSRLALRRVPGTTHRALVSPGLHREIFAVTPADISFTPLVVTFLQLLDNVSRDIATSPSVLENGQCQGFTKDTEPDGSGGQSFKG